MYKVNFCLVVKNKNTDRAFRATSSLEKQKAIKNQVKHHKDESFPSLMS